MISTIKTGRLSQSGRVGVAGVLLALLAAVTAAQAAVSAGPDRVLGASSLPAGYSSGTSQSYQAQQKAALAYQKAIAAAQAKNGTTASTRIRAAARNS